MQIHMHIHMHNMHIHIHIHTCMIYILTNIHICIYTRLEVIETIDVKMNLIMYLFICSLLFAPVCHRCFAKAGR